MLHKFIIADEIGTAAYVLTNWPVMQTFTHRSRAANAGNPCRHPVPIMIRSNCCAMSDQPTTDNPQQFPVAPLSRPSWIGGHGTEP